MFEIRLAREADLDFLVDADRSEEGVSHTEPAVWSEQETAAHRAKIAAFVTQPSDAAWIAQGPAGGRRGTIMVRFRDRLREEPTAANLFLFRFLDEGIWPRDGRFCEVFQLWVDPFCRRQGLATALKRTAEIEAVRRGITMMYTHTEQRNAHVVELNRKMGYREVRRGPLWDEVIRVSLVKELYPAASEGLIIDVDHSGRPTPPPPAAAGCAGRAAPPTGRGRS